jgi:hypothetical protein
MIRFNFVVVACSPPPNITVSFGGKAWHISAAEIIVPVASGSAKCEGAILESESDNWNFGHAFLVRVCFFVMYRFSHFPIARNISTLYYA